jgi:hypothetical protein
MSTGMDFGQWQSLNSGGTADDYNAYLARTGDELIRRSGQRRFTRDEVVTLANRGTDLVTGDDNLYLSDRDFDLINLVMNAALSMLDDEPPVTLNEMIERNWQPDLECKTCGEPVEMYDMDENGENGKFRHAYVKITYDHEPVAEDMTQVVRGWING